MIQDFKLLAAAVNLDRLAALGLGSTASGWQLQLANQQPPATGDHHQQPA